MHTDLRGRSLLKESDFSADELRALLALAADLKAEARSGSRVQRLDGRQLAILFDKSSTRTRAAFQVAAQDQGAHVTAFEAGSSQLGHKESVTDTARVLGRMFDAIAYRGAAHEVVESLAANAGIPVYNGLTDDWHPTQSLADYMTMQEHSGKPLEALSYAFVGDLRFNMGRSLLMMGALMGSDVRLIGPSSLRPPSDVESEARSIAERTGARVTITDDLAAVEGVDFIHTDVWVSMGEPREAWQGRVQDLTPYQVNRGLLERSGNDDVRFMHCLPAFHDDATAMGAEMLAVSAAEGGLEVTDEVFESASSIVFDQAENRLHTIKAILVATLAAEA